MQLARKQVDLQGNEETIVYTLAPMIVGIEVALQPSFLQKVDLRQPNVQLNKPLRLCSAVSTWCINVLVLFVHFLNISIKNRNPMDLGISENCVISAMVLDSF